MKFLSTDFHKEILGCGFLRLFPPFHMHFQAPMRAQRHTLLRHDGLSLDQFEAKGAQEVGEQN